MYVYKKGSYLHIIIFNQFSVGVMGEPYCWNYRIAVLCCFICSVFNYVAYNQIYSNAMASSDLFASAILHNSVHCLRPFR